MGGGGEGPTPPRPQDDLYRHVNAHWLAENPMSKFPAYGRWGVFEALADEALAKTRSSMEADDGKANAWFESGMRANEQDSHAALAPTLQICREFANAVDARNFAAVAAATAELHAAGVSILFGVGDSPDKKNSAWSLAAIGQGGLALPDRDYYLSDAPDRVAIRDKYEAHVAKTLALAMPETYPDAVAAAAAARDVLAFETRLARSHLTPAERRDAERTYNKFASLETLPGGGSGRSGVEGDDGAFDWRAYFEASGKPDPGEINVSWPPALACAAGAVCGASDSDSGDSVSSAAALAYASFHAVCRASDYLDDRFVDLDFEFFGKELNGEKELKPRWKRVVRHADALIGELVGKAYVQTHFPESAKASAEALVRNVTAAVEARLRELPWMSEATKAAALAKMSSFRVKIGYPDEWIDYAALVVQKDGSYYANVVAAKKFAHARSIARVDAPVDRERWFMAPQQVNAYYHPMLNEIVFPAAILQPPFFDPNADPAINFGGIGAVIGHEITHGFDDQGRKFDKDGNMNDWWSTSDAADFVKRAKVMVDQAGRTVVHTQDDACEEKLRGPFSLTKPGIRAVASNACQCRVVNGELTQGENIADLGGLRLAYRAWRMSRADGDPNGAPENFPPEPEKRFFFSWATVWRQNITAKLAAKYIAVDPHAPCEVRVNGTVSNMPEFVEAFGVREGDGLFRAEADRVDIW
jgi:putative endopeptidase